MPVLRDALTGTLQTTPADSIGFVSHDGLSACPTGVPWLCKLGLFRTVGRYAPAGRGCIGDSSIGNVPQIGFVSHGKLLPPGEQASLVVTP